MRIPTPATEVVHSMEVPARGFDNNARNNNEDDNDLGIPGRIMAMVTRMKTIRREKPRRTMTTRTRTRLVGRTAYRG